jgi:CRISPR-associated protein Cas1
MKQNLYIFSDVKIRRKQNTLYFETIVHDEETEGEIELIKDDYLFDEEIVVPAGDKKYMPVENVESITVFGSAHFNSRLIYFLSRNLIPLYLVTWRGTFAGAFFPLNQETHGSVLIEQAKAFYDEDKRTEIASKIVDATAHNTLVNLNYYKNRGKNLSETIEIIEELKAEIPFAESVEELMGIEGYIKRNYYEAFREIFDYPVEFYGREKRPSGDYVNAMISFGNAVLYSAVTDQILHSKLYPEIGFMHTPGENKLSLAYDIADIYKPLIVDRAVFKAVNKNILSEKDFFRKKGVCLMKKETKRKFVELLEDKLLTKIKTDYSDKKFSYKRIIREDLYTLRKFITENEELKFYKSRW